MSRKDASVLALAALLGCAAPNGPATLHGPPESGPRPALFNGIFLTHAHMGHYAGLLELGREAYGAREVATWCTPRFAGFLRASGPWSVLVEERHGL